MPASTYHRTLPPEPDPAPPGTRRSVNAAACEVLNMLETWIGDGGEIKVGHLEAAADILRRALGETS